MKVVKGREAGVRKKAGLFWGWGGGGEVCIASRSNFLCHYFGVWCRVYDVGLCTFLTFYYV